MPDGQAGGTAPRPDGGPTTARDGGDDRAAALGTSWDRNAASWTAIVRTGGVASRRLATDGAIVDAVLAQAPRSLLDVGCGEGWLCRALAGRVPRIAGIDGSAALVARARELGGATFAHLRYADLRDAAILAGERFDAIVANFALLDDDLSGFLAAARGRIEDRGALLIQTLHPGTAAPPYRSGWRTEDFAAFPGGTGWEPMPWYFRTLADWLGALRPNWRLRDLIEPLHPETGRPASLILIADPA